MDSGAAHISVIWVGLMSHSLPFLSPVTYSPPSFSPEFSFSMFFQPPYIDQYSTVTTLPHLLIWFSTPQYTICFLQCCDRVQLARLWRINERQWYGQVSEIWQVGFRLLRFLFQHKQLWKETAKHRPLHVQGQCNVIQQNVGYLLQMMCVHSKEDLSLCGPLKNTGEAKIGFNTHFWGSICLRNHEHDFLALLNLSTIEWRLLWHWILIPQSEGSISAKCWLE